MQWRNTTARRELCNRVFSKLSDSEGLENLSEILHSYSTTWKNEVTLANKSSDHFHGLGCHFIQSAIGLTFPFNFKDKKWTFDSWIEYRVKPLKENDLPCPCIWEEKCSKFKTSKDKLTTCLFGAKGPRRFDFCWIEKYLLDNVAITAEVEMRNNIKTDLAKLFSIFKNSTRNHDDFGMPIVHVQLDLSGRDSKKTIADFMNRHFSSGILSPSIICINQKAKFGKWSVTLFAPKRNPKTKYLEVSSQIFCKLGSCIQDFQSL